MDAELVRRESAGLQFGSGEAITVQTEMALEHIFLLRSRNIPLAQIISFDSQPQQQGTLCGLYEAEAK